MALEFSCTITKNAFYHLETKWNESNKLRPLILLAAAVTVAVSPILFLGDIVRSVYRSAIRGIPSDDYHYFYSTEIFSTYVKQLQDYVSSELKTYPDLSSEKIVQWILNPMKNKKEFYEGIITQLREQVRFKNGLMPHVALFIERLCSWIYTGPKLLPTMTSWVKSHMTENEKQALTKDTCHHMIKDTLSRWNSEAKFQGEIFQDYRSYDPRLLGDTPSHFFRVHNTDVIRTPAITKDGTRSSFGHLKKAEIVEEFHGLLDHYRRIRKEHLYVNLMSPSGSEKLRIEALEELEKSNSDVFHLITLSKDCLFYHQWGRFSTPEFDNYETFKESFINEMFGNHPGYHWPASWDRDWVKKECIKAINHVHQKNFGSAKTMTREERCNFIEIAYTEIINTFLMSKSPATCNVSCRSCIDRGAVNLSLLYARTQPLDDRVSHETLTTIAVAPALIAQSRVMLPFRMHRLVPALAQMIKS